SLGSSASRSSATALRAPQGRKKARPRNTPRTPVLGTFNIGLASQGPFVLPRFAKDHPWCINPSSPPRQRRRIKQYRRLNRHREHLRSSCFFLDDFPNHSYDQVERGRNNPKPPHPPPHRQPRRGSLTHSSGGIQARPRPVTSAQPIS